MKKIANFIDKWGLVISLCCIELLVLFSLGCSIHTSIKVPFAGIIGSIGAIFSIGIIALWIYLEIISQHYDSSNNGD